MPENLDIYRHIDNIPLRYKPLVAWAAAATKVNVFAREQTLPEPMAQIWTTEPEEVDLSAFRDELERLMALQETEA